MDNPRRTVRLVDGRRVEFVEYGNPEGRAVINCHGGLVCARDIEPAHDTAVELGLRLISPNRPGINDSDRKPGRTMQDWVADLEALANQLRLDSFATIGWSMGGQYALALAHGLASRVSHATVIAGCAPLDQRQHFDSLTRMDKRLTKLSQQWSPVARSTFAGMRTMAASAPKRFLASSARTMGPDDAIVINRPDTQYVSLIREGLRHTTGAVDDYTTWVKPWGFAPGEVRTPVQLWWGESDRLVARNLMQSLSDQLPNASFTVVPKAGHFLAFDRWDDVLAPLAE